MSRKSKSFGQLLAYVNAPDPALLGPVWLHNVQAQEDDLDGIRREFVANAGVLQPRKNGNVLYHEILSLAAADRERVTVEILEDLVRWYLERRAPYALAYARAHLDTACPHVHLVISANAVGSTRRIRWSKNEFLGMQRELERYQRERYPFLEHSRVVRDGKGKKAGRREGERKRRTRKPSRKEQVAGIVRAELALATSGAEWSRRLDAHGLRPYRRGRSVGVEELADGRRYRLRTLGLMVVFREARKAWERVRERQDVRRDRDVRREMVGPERGRSLER